MKWINNSPPGNPIQLVPVNWSVCVSRWGNTGNSVQVLWVPTSDPVSQLERQKWRVVVTADALFSTVPAHCVPPATGPSAFSINRHVCAPHLFVLIDDFCNKTQTFWYFLDSWLMTLRFAFLGSWPFPVENVACRNYCSCFLVCLWDLMKNRMSLVDVPPTTIKSRHAVCWRTHKMKKQALHCPLRHDNRGKVFKLRKCHDILFYRSVLAFIITLII